MPLNPITPDTTLASLHVSPDNLPTTIIQPQYGWLSLNLDELWRYRDLLLILVWRDISARYRQSVLGIGWAIFRPLFSAFIFTIVFSVFVHVKTDFPYPLFSFAALIPWMYFSNTLTSITVSVVNYGTILNKVYFPRMILPMAAAGSGLIEVIIQLVILGLMMLCYSQPPSLSLLMLPGFALICMINAFAIGIWLTALNVLYRDVGMAVPFFLQIGMYLCPIMYPLTAVPDRFRAVYSLNPMVAVIEGFRWSVLGGEPPELFPLIISLGATIVLLVTGMFYFRRIESTFADLI